MACFGTGQRCRALQRAGLPSAAFARRGPSRCTQEFAGNGARSLAVQLVGESGFLGDSSVEHPSRAPGKIIALDWLRSV